MQFKVEVPRFMGYADLKLGDRIEEVKSVSGAVFSKIVNGKIDIWKEKMYNVLQLGYYMVDAELDGRLIYISRDSISVDGFSVDGGSLIFRLSGDIKVHSRDIPLDARLIKAVGDEMEMLRSIKETPEAEPRMDNECEWCDYRTMCYKESGVMF